MDVLSLILNVCHALINLRADHVNLWINMTPAERIEEDLFFIDFRTRMDKLYEELNSEFKVYSLSTQAQGQI